MPCAFRTLLSATSARSIKRNVAPMSGSAPAALLACRGAAKFASKSSKKAQMTLGKPCKGLLPTYETAVQSVRDSRLASQRFMVNGRMTSKSTFRLRTTDGKRFAVSKKTVKISIFGHLRLREGKTPAKDASQAGREETCPHYAGQHQLGRRLLAPEHNFGNGSEHRPPLVRCFGSPKRKPARAVSTLPTFRCDRSRTRRVGGAVALPSPAALPQPLEPQSLAAAKRLTRAF